MLSTKGENSFITIMIGLMVAVIVGVAITIPAIQYVVYQAETPTATSQTINFAVDDTYYVVALTPLHAVTGIYNSSAKTYQFPTSQYTVDIVGNKIKIAVNGTGVYPNMTVGNKYVEYTYEAQGYIGTPMLVSLIRLIPLFVVLIIILAVVGVMKFKGGV